MVQNLFELRSSNHWDDWTMQLIIAL